MVRDSMSALPPGEMFSLIKFLFKDDIFASLKSPKSLAASDLARASPSAPFLWRMSCGNDKDLLQASGSTAAIRQTAQDRLHERSQAHR